MYKLLVLLVTSIVVAFAADVDGNWKATAEGPQGRMERTFTFKAEGDKLTGETTSSLLGKSVIKNGKVQGNTVTFDIDAQIGGESMTISYKGMIDGDNIKLTSHAGGNSFEWTGAKVK